MSQENVDVVRQVFDASSRRDADAVLELYHAEVEWDVSRTAPGELSDVVRGHDGLRRFFREWGQARGSDEYAPDELIYAGDAVVSVATQRSQGRASGVNVARLIAGVWTVRDGKVVRVVWFPSRAEALEATGLRE